MILIILIVCFISIGVGAFLYLRRKKSAAAASVAAPKKTSEIELLRQQISDMKENDQSTLEAMRALRESIEKSKPKPKAEPVPVKKEATYADIDTTKGHPRGYGSHHVPYGGTWHTVAPGKAQTPEACWEHAKRNKLSNWGWRSHDKSCWSYMDSYLWSGGGGVSPHNHIGGCTEPGVKLEDGCLDLNNGDVVVGHKGGLAGGYNNFAGQEKMTFKKCRYLAAKKGIRVFGYRTNRQPDSNWTNTCFAPNNPDNLGGFIGSATDHAHMMACTNKDKKMRDDCR